MFSKRFPRHVEGSVYPKWVEVSLSAEEEAAAESSARVENALIFRECIDDAEKIASDKGLKASNSDIMGIASSLFDKRASHAVYFKEGKCKEKFEASNS